MNTAPELKPEDLALIERVRLPGESAVFPAWVGRLLDAAREEGRAEMAAVTSWGDGRTEPNVATGAQRFDPSVMVSPPAPPLPEDLEGLVREAWQDLLEVDDRTSPAEYPEMCLITREELAAFMQRALSAQPAPTVSGEGLERKLIKARDAYTETHRNWAASGATEAERRFSAGECDDTARERLHEALAELDLNDVNAILAALRPAVSGGAETTGHVQVMDGPAPIEGLAEAGRILAGPAVSGEVAGVYPGWLGTTQPCDTCGAPVAVNAVSPSECFCSDECADPERSQAGAGVLDRAEADAAIRRLRFLMEPGHCGEGMEERKQRDQNNGYLELAILALSPRPAGVAETQCFECGHALNGPYCPTCNPAVPPGYKLAPEEPTEAMLVAAGATPAGVMPRGGVDRTRRMLPKWWAAMLAAAPAPGEGDDQ